MSRSRKRCMHFTDIPDVVGINITRRCVKMAGHDDVHAWTRSGEASWLPNVPKDVRDAFAKAVRK